MKKTDLSTYNNEWYQPGKSGPVRLLWYLINAVVFNTHLFPMNRLKVILLKSFGATIGEGVIIKPKVNIKYPWKLIIGDYTWIGEEVWIDNLAAVRIGANCCISQGAMLLCGNHNYKKVSFDLITDPIVLEDAVWVGAKAVVCPGVIAAANSVLTVGSIATGNLEASFIYQGNPATKLKERIIN